MEKYVISISNETQELAGYYSATTQSDGAISNDINEAALFSSRSEARATAGRYQALSPDVDVVVQKVAVTVKLAV